MDNIIDYLLTTMNDNSIVIGVVCVIALAIIIFLFINRKKLKLRKYSILGFEFDFSPRDNIEFISENLTLGASFRRYFAQVIDRPFYQLPGHLQCIERIRLALSQQKSPLIIVLTGSGGVGKTSIAGEVIRRSNKMGFLKPVGDSAKIWEYKDGKRQVAGKPAFLGWETFVDTVLKQLGSASMTGLPLNHKTGWLKNHFRNEKYLVLIDNLETIDNARMLAESLRNLLRGSKSRAIITYRYHDLGVMESVSEINITGLSETESLQFIEEELKGRGYINLQEWLDEKSDSLQDLLELIRGVMGLPLALQLIVGLRTRMGFSNIQSLIGAVDTDKRIDDLYYFLYNEELRLISEPARKILIEAYSLKSEYSQSDLQAFFGMESDQITMLLDELTSYSLVYRLHDRHLTEQIDERFFIHPLLHNLLHNIYTG